MTSCESVKRRASTSAFNFARLPFLLAISCTALSAASCTRPNIPPAIAAPAPRPSPTPTLAPISERRVDARGITYVFRASRLTNLAWQLDCLAGFGRCSQPAYAALWRDRLQAEPELRTALAHWGELRQQLRGPVGEQLESRSLLPVPQPKADLWQRVRFASVVADDPAAYASALNALTDTPSADALRAALARFDLAFSTIWAEVLPVLERAMTEQAALQRREDVALTIQRVAAFYGSSLGTPPTMRFDFLYRPEHASADFATQLLDHGLIEVVASEKPEHRIQPPVHEMFHYLFASAGFSKLDELASRFAASPDPNALAAYGLLDEVLATGLAQGVLGGELSPAELQARLAIPLRLYDNAFIDAVTKSFLPALNALLREPVPGGTVFTPEFQTAYLASVQVAFPHGMPPASELRPLACAYSKDLSKAHDALRAGSGSRVVGSADQPDSEDARSLIEDHATWGRVLLLKTSELGVLGRYVKSLPNTEAPLRTAARKNRRFAYATRAAGSGPVFVLVADDDEQARKLVAEFMSLESPFVGLGLANPRGGG